MRIIVSNLAPDVKSEELKNIFLPYGRVTSVSISKNPASGESQGHVEMEEGGSEAINELNGYKVHGKPIAIADADTDSTFKAESQQQEREDDIE